MTIRPNRHLSLTYTVMAHKSSFRGDGRQPIELANLVIPCAAQQLAGALQTRDPPSRF